MFSRISSLALAIALASCGGAGADIAGGERIACALPGSERFSEDCQIERSPGSEGTILTIRHPDGGFRRLAVTTDGRGVIAADGAEPALVTPLAEGLIEVTLGDARYRIPATVKAAQ